MFGTSAFATDVKACIKTEEEVSKSNVHMVTKFTVLTGLETGTIYFMNVTKDRTLDVM